MGILFTDCRIIDCTGAPPIADGALLVEGNSITAVGPRADVLRSAGNGHVAFPLNGKTVLPGLWDAHIHLGATVPPWEHHFRNESEAHYAFRCVRKAQDNLHLGITALRTMGDRFNADIELKRAINSGVIVGPRLWVAGDVGWSRQEAGEDTFRLRARERLRQGADHIKLFATGGIAWPAETITHTISSTGELRAAIEEAHRWRKPATVHAIGDEGVRMAAEAGADSVEHGFVLGLDGIKAMAEHGTIFSPQLTVTEAWNEGLIDHAGCFPAWFRTNAIEARIVHHRFAAEAFRAGLTMVAGVDNLPKLPLTAGVENYQGRPALVSEIQLMHEIGMTPIQALMTATLNAAKVCRADARLGSLEAGKLADVIAVDGDPSRDLAALHSVRLVMKDGKLARCDQPLPSGADSAVLPGAWLPGKDVLLPTEGYSPPRIP
ncbi:MAG: amidohydrolase family protein [Chloroflexota bacterium]